MVPEFWGGRADIGVSFVAEHLIGSCSLRVGGL